MKRLILLLLVFALGLGAGLAFYVRKELRTSGNPAQGLILEIPRGLGARDVVRLLEDKNVIRNRLVAQAYIFYTGSRNRLQAGEYLFDRPQTIPEVVDKLSSGQVYLHKFTVPEGLTLQVTAQKWQEQGFGSGEEFMKAAAASIDLVHRFDS